MRTSQETQSDKAGPRHPWWLRNRFWIQVASIVLANSFFLRHFKGFCYPVLNCWSCPGANFACPIGALQNASSDAGFRSRTRFPQASSPRSPSRAGHAVFQLSFGRMMGLAVPFGCCRSRSRLRQKLPIPTPELSAMPLAVVLIIPYTHTHSKPAQGVYGLRARRPLERDDAELVVAKQAILLAVLVAMPGDARLRNRLSTWPIFHCCTRGMDIRFDQYATACVSGEGRRIDPAACERHARRVRARVIARSTAPARRPVSGEPVGH